MPEPWESKPADPRDQERVLAWCKARGHWPRWAPPKVGPTAEERFAEAADTIAELRERLAVLAEQLDEVRDWKATAAVTIQTLTRRVEEQERTIEELELSLERFALQTE